MRRVASMFAGFAVAILGLVAAAPAAADPGPPEFNETEVIRGSQTLVIINDCTGEEFLVESRFVIRSTQVVTDGRALSTTGGHQEATNLTTGSSYVGSITDAATSVQDLDGTGGACTSVFTVVLNRVAGAPTDDDDPLIHTTVHFTVNDHGVPTAEHVSQHFVCR